MIQPPDKMDKHQLAAELAATSERWTEIERLSFIFDRLYDEYSKFTEQELRKKVEHVRNKYRLSTNT